MRGEEWKAAAEAEAIHAGDADWGRDFRPTERRDVALTLGAALLSIFGFPVFGGLAAGWGLVALLTWLTLLGFGLGHLRVPRNGALLLGLHISLWLTCQNVLTGREALGVGGVICLTLPALIGWQLAQGRREGHTP